MLRHLRSLQDFTKEELNRFIERAIELKRERQSGVCHRQLVGKTIGLLFEKPSTRTRVSFEVAAYGLGGQVIFLSSKDTQLARSEPLKDMARVMDRYVDAMVVRTFGQEVVDELARYSSVPVINALTNPGGGGRTGPLFIGAGHQCLDQSPSSLPDSQRYDDRD